LLSECLKKCCSRKYIVARVLAKSLCAYFDWNLRLLSVLLSKNKRGVKTQLCARAQ
jgi:hypothetical protein